MPWQELVGFSETQGLLAQKLYVIVSEPTGGLGPIMDNIDRHLAYQAGLEEDGTIRLRCRSCRDRRRAAVARRGHVRLPGRPMEAARRLADSDPMHQSGARSYRVRPWLLNEGTASVRVFYSGRKPVIG